MPGRRWSSLKARAPRLSVPCSAAAARIGTHPTLPTPRAATTATETGTDQGGLPGSFWPARGLGIRAGRGDVIHRRRRDVEADSRRLCLAAAVGIVEAGAADRRADHVPAPAPGLRFRAPT